MVHGFSPPAPPRCVFQNRSRRRWRARARKRMEESLAGCGSAAPADQCRCSHANSDGADRASIAHWTVKDLSGRCFDLTCLSSETVPSLQEVSTSIGIPRDAFKTMVIHDRTIYLIRDLRGGSNPGVPPSPHAPPPPVSQRRHAPCTVAGRGGRVAKRTAEQSVGEAKVAKAKQRILAGQYGRSTPKNNRVKEVVNDLSLSGK